jgi:hypothetical protein
MNFQPEQNKNSEQKADDMHVSQRSINAIVGRSVGNKY